MPYLDIFKLNFKKTVKILESSTLEFTKVQNFMQISANTYSFKNFA